MKKKKYSVKQNNFENNEIHELIPYQNQRRSEVKNIHVDYHNNSHKVRILA